MFQVREEEFLRLVYVNPHNIWPQSRATAVYTDGDITTEELREVRDPDRDGLINLYEARIGTEPQNPDTDGDGLMDGWEWAEAVVIRGNHIPLNGADPLHKDIYLRVIPIDGNLSSKIGGRATNEEPINDSEARQILVDRFGNANVTNPDGETGIDLHISYEEGNLEQYRNSTISYEDERDIADNIELHKAAHPYWGAYYFSLLDSKFVPQVAPGGYTLLQPHYVNWVDPDPFDDHNRSEIRHFVPHATEEHELLHDIVGYLDPDIQEYNDATHTRRGAGDLRIDNPHIASELSRDGILGLPRRNTGLEEEQGYLPAKVMAEWTGNWTMPGANQHSG